jgi:hypothetical protein
MTGSAVEGRRFARGQTWTFELIEPLTDEQKHGCKGDTDVSRCAGLKESGHSVVDGGRHTHDYPHDAVGGR